MFLALSPNFDVLSQNFDSYSCDSTSSVKRWRVLLFNLGFFHFFQLFPSVLDAITKSRFMGLFFLAIIGENCLFFGVTFDTIPSFSEAPPPPVASINIPRPSKSVWIFCSRAENPGKHDHVCGGFTRHYFPESPAPQVDLSPVKHRSTTFAWHKRRISAETLSFSFFTRCFLSS